MFQRLLRWACTLGFVVMFVVPTVAQEKPTTSGRRALSMITGGVLVGTTGLIIAEETVGSVAWVLVPLVGHAGGSAIGVSLVGANKETSGSFWGAYLGAVGGEVLGILLVVATWDDSGFFGNPTYGGVIAYLICPPIGATIGYNLTRRYKTRPSGTQATTPDLRRMTSTALPPKDKTSPFADRPDRKTVFVPALRIAF